MKEFFCFLIERIFYMAFCIVTLTHGMWAIFDHLIKTELDMFKTVICFVAGIVLFLASIGKLANF